MEKQDRDPDGGTDSDDAVQHKVAQCVLETWISMQRLRFVYRYSCTTCGHGKHCWKGA